VDLPPFAVVLARLVAGFAVRVAAVLRPLAPADAFRAGLAVPALVVLRVVAVFRVVPARVVPARVVPVAEAVFARPVAAFVPRFAAGAARPRVPALALVDAVRDVAVFAGALRAAVPRVVAVLVVAALRVAVARLPAVVVLRFVAAVAARGAFAAAALRPAVPRVPRSAGRRVGDRRRGFFSCSGSGVAASGSAPPCGICSVSSLMR
jgi:hypothetical protein